MPTQDKPGAGEPVAQAHTPEDTARAIRMEQSRETARSIYHQVCELTGGVMAEPETLELEYRNKFTPALIMDYAKVQHDRAETKAQRDELLEALNLIETKAMERTIDTPTLCEILDLARAAIARAEAKL